MRSKINNAGVRFGASLRVGATLFLLFGMPAAAASFPAIADTPFVQEYRTEVAYPDTPGARQARAIAVTPDGALWLAAKAGVFRYLGGAWSQPHRGSTYALAAQGTTVWAGAWDGLYRISSEGEQKVAAIDAPVVALWADKAAVIAAGQQRFWQLEGNSGSWTSRPWKGARGVRAIARDAGGGLWVATRMGGYYLPAQGPMREYHDESQLLSGSLFDVKLAPDGSVWLASDAGVDIYRKGVRSGHFDASNGMPNQQVRALEVEPDGTIWMGTPLGALRRANGRWSLRHSRRWLPSDEVLTLAVGRNGDVWVATGAGLSVIHRKKMTLAQKAEYYQQILEARHVRPPGLVEQCNLKRQGDTSEFLPRDDDNDGQYTSMYLAMESFRYAATHDPRALANAAKTFRALRFLQEVTGTSGFVARTVVPAVWTRVHDPNQALSDEDRIDRQVQNPRSKNVEKRWRPSADGKWLWKGDTSSDEITGHFYGYLMYYNLAATGAGDRQAVRDHVRRLMDYLIAGDYTLRDIDGTPTLWGVWTPERLLHHPDWRAERWTNALELLSYLQTTYYLTGDSKYRKRYMELIDRYRFDRLARRPLATEPSERTYFDHELVALAFPGVMTEKDPGILAVYREALHFWIGDMRNDLSSYYNFTWASLSGAQDPRSFALPECVDAMREQPLDLVQWTVDNRRREDVRFVHRPDIERPQLSRILPVSERGLIRWDGNPYNVTQGENGMSESSGVFWLLPYWMGRYYNYIGVPTTH